jgi:hypothetical protein
VAVEKGKEILVLDYQEGKKYDEIFYTFNFGPDSKYILLTLGLSEKFY